MDGDTPNETGWLQQRRAVCGQSQPVLGQADPGPTEQKQMVWLALPDRHLQHRTNVLIAPVHGSVALGARGRASPASGIVLGGGDEPETLGRATSGTCAEVPGTRVMHVQSSG